MVFVLFSLSLSLSRYYTRCLFWFGPDFYLFNVFFCPALMFAIVLNSKQKKWNRFHARLIFNLPKLRVFSSGQLCGAWTVTHASNEYHFCYFDPINGSYMIEMACGHRIRLHRCFINPKMAQPNATSIEQCSSFNSIRGICGPLDCALEFQSDSGFPENCNRICNNKFGAHWAVLTVCGLFDATTHVYGAEKNRHGHVNDWLKC